MPVSSPPNRGIGWAQSARLKLPEDIPSMGRSMGHQKRCGFWAYSTEKPLVHHQFLHLWKSRQEFEYLQAPDTGRNRRPRFHDMLEKGKRAGKPCNCEHEDRDSQECVTRDQLNHSLTVSCSSPHGSSAAS